MTHIMKIVIVEEQEWLTDSMMSEFLKSGLECSRGGRVATVTAWAPHCQLGWQAGGPMRASSSG